MSNYPFGLRGDPFVPPATLSAKEASRLIRRRIRACNGDGGLLFPIDACDAIHAAARGVPEAILMLAGCSLAIAAADKARCVTPAHVKRAAEEAPVAVAAAPAPASAPAEPDLPAPAVEPQSALEEAQAEAAPAAVPERTSEPEARAGKQARTPQPAPQPVDAGEDADEDDEAVVEAVAEVATAAPGIESFDYADSDLPPFRPASVALPTRPSEDLPQEAREWVSRFIPSQPGPPPAAQSDAPRTAADAEGPAPPRAATKGSSKSKSKPAKSKAPEKPRPLIQVPELDDDIPSPASMGRLAEVYAPRTPPARRAPRPSGPRRSNTSRALVGVMGVVALLAVVLRYSTPGHLATPDGDSSRPVRTATRASEPEISSQPEVTVAPHESHTTSGPPAGSAFHEARGGSPAGGSAPLAGAESAPAVEPVKRTSPSSRYALEVASFIFEERARQERDRLEAAGLHARVVTTLEFGSRVYRVVVGGYPHPAAAERAADSLLSNGVVLQARVVSGTPSRPPTP